MTSAPRRGAQSSRRNAAKMLVLSETSGPCSRAPETPSRRPASVSRSASRSPSRTPPHLSRCADEAVGRPVGGEGGGEDGDVCGLFRGKEPLVVVEVCGEACASPGPAAIWTFVPGGGLRAVANLMPDGSPAIEPGVARESRPRVALGRPRRASARRCPPTTEARQAGVPRSTVRILWGRHDQILPTHTRTPRRNPRCVALRMWLATNARWA